MFENYTHSKEDLEAVEEALEYLERPELDLVFKDRNLINNTLVISFDSKELFIWTKLKHPKLKNMPCRVNDYYTYLIPHKIKIRDKDQSWWRSNLLKKEFWGYLPREFQKSWLEIPKISGGLLKPFTSLHKKFRARKKREPDPYYTRESYLATIIHEFGHVYYGRRNPWYYSKNTETINYMKLALDLYEEKRRGKLKDTPLRLLSRKNLGEVFAFCTDYYTSSIFWPSHRKEIDKENQQRIREAIEKERRSNLDREDTFLVEPHAFASVFGKIILERYPKNWPSKLLVVGSIKEL